MKSGISKADKWLCHHKDCASIKFNDAELTAEAWYSKSSEPVKGYFEKRDTYTMLGFLLFYDMVPTDEEDLGRMSSEREVKKAVESLMLKLSLNMMDDKPWEVGTYIP